MTVFAVRPRQLQFKERIEAREATLEEGRWAVQIGAAILAGQRPRSTRISYSPCSTSLTAAQVRGTAFSTPETVSFWQLPELYPVVRKALGSATAGYRLQYHKLIAQPFLLAAMVMVGGLGEPAVLPVGRGSKDGFKWRGRRVSALRSVESYRRFEQGRVDASDRCGVVARVRGRPHRLFLALLYQEDG